MHVERREEPAARAASRHAAGFSLIELLIVMVIVIVLVTLTFNTGKSRQERQREACSQNLEKIYLALEIYSNDNGGKFPDAPAARTSEQALAALVPHYTSDTSIFLCPAAGGKPLRDGEAFRDWKISYACYMGRRAADGPQALMSDAQVNTESKTRGEQVFSTDGRPPGNNHGRSGGNILLGDGSVQFTPPRAASPLLSTPPVALLNP